MTKLTKRQQEILSLIEAHMDATGSPPTRAEIAKTMGFKSPNAAEDHLRALARKGVIELVPGTSRGIRLNRLSNGVPVVKLESLSSQFSFSDTPVEGTCKLEKNFFKPSIDFILHYTQKGGLPDLNILENDYLAIYQTQELRAGQIALVRVNQELTLKRYSSEQNQKGMVEGLVVGVIRSLSNNALVS